MKKCFFWVLICALVFKSFSALCETNELEEKLLAAMFPTVYDQSVNSFVSGLYYTEPPLTYRELAELVIYPDEVASMHSEDSYAAAFNPETLSFYNGYISFGGTYNWAYANARSYPDHKDVNENLFLLIGICAQGIRDRIINTPELVIRLKNRDKTKVVSINKLEIVLDEKIKYTFHKAIQHEGNNFFYLGNVGKQLLQDIAKKRNSYTDTIIRFRFYFDPFYFTGADLSSYPESIVGYLKSGELFEIIDEIDYEFTLADISVNLVDSRIYDYINADILINADTQHNATVEEIIESI